MTATKCTQKPAKPYDGYPLFAHSRGYWCKKFRGKQYNCGPWADPAAALARWHEIRNELEVGNELPAKKGQLTVDYLVNAFLDSKNAQLQRGDLSPKTFRQYKPIAAWLRDSLGAERAVESLGPADFKRIRAMFPQHWSTTTITNQITISRCIFKWAFDDGLIKTPIQYGTHFSKPSARKRRLERASKPKKEFSHAEMQQLLKHASDEMRAWILLGLNCGYGNTDLSVLRVDMVNGVWLTEVRNKNGAERRAWLWPETRKALKTVLAKHDGGERVFQTAHGNPLVCEEGGRRDAVTGEFAKFKKACGCDRKGVGFYSFRHMCETIGGNVNDQVAVDHIMGHADESMAAVYRERVFDARIKKVCQHVREWLFGGEA